MPPALTPTALIFMLHLLLGYVPWLLVIATFRPRWAGADALTINRAIALLHSFRFFGLAFLVPGVVGAGLPSGFAGYAAWGDFTTGVLAMLALLAIRIRPLFWTLVVAFNAVGALDILSDYLHGISDGLPAQAGTLGALYAIPIIYVPLLMITHVIAFATLWKVARRRTA